MSQHFLLTAQARDLSLMKLFTMSDDEAFENFKAVRWSDNKGKPVCPSCGNCGEHYFLTTRRHFRCKECNHTFSVTSGTLFASHKLPLKVYLIAIALFTNAVKSISALQFSRDLDVQYKTAWVLSHKIRESLLLNQNNEKLSGVCEVDGVYVGNYIRPANNIEDRIDRRQAYKPNKRTVISIRQRAEINSKCVGSVRTKTFITKGENTSDIKEIIYNSIELGAIIHADEHTGYDHFHAHYDMKRVNHSIEYKSMDGACNNQSESYNARFRRMQYGQCHKISNLYLSNYANEIAYREDTRRMSNGAIFNDIFSKCLATPVSNEFCGYWQGNKRVSERLGA
ncbi:IS1595 family transposase [Sulfurospirillum multivorans]|uniref:Transposase n=2 Tax=Sulfurospirillum multivorans TaxID=66821 RepID=A0AA86ANX6_SULMK|nr:IS1595 family transposase [Sulfurospirillum multivorans]AHJ14360.1 putative transposase [Sulfurospirillum multivorans DSM 12446]QEH07845.1 putative transposase [Sulfurospirillum multivorans]